MTRCIPGLLGEVVGLPREGEPAFREGEPAFGEGE